MSRYEEDSEVPPFQIRSPSNLGPFKVQGSRSQPLNIAYDTVK